MAITLVPSAFLAADLTAGSASGAIDTSGANLLVGGASYFTAAPTYTDAKGNTWGSAVVHTDFFSQGNLDSRYVSAPNVGTGETVTPVTNAGALTLAAFQGVKVSAPLDGSNFSGLNTSTGVSTIPSTSVTPSMAGCLIVALLYFESGTVNSISGGFTLLAQVVGGSGAAIAYLVQGAAAATAPSWTMSTGQTRANSHLLVFQPEPVPVDGNKAIARQASSRRPGPYQPMGGGLKNPRQRFH